MSSLFCAILHYFWWGGLELNQHSRWTADLQSVELTTCTAFPIKDLLSRA